MRTAVDTNVLLDLTLGDEPAASAAREALFHAMGNGSLVICPVVYAELSAAFDSRRNLDQFVQDLQIHLDDFAADALFQAGSAVRHYSQRRGRVIECPSCGHKAEILCPSCSRVLSWRQHILPDFLIGGHASAQADCLLTRDGRFYRSYFTDLPVVVPGKPAS